jgi:hypothetical protein
MTAPGFTSEMLIFPMVVSLAAYFQDKTNGVSHDTSKDCQKFTLIVVFGTMEEVFFRQTLPKNR